MGARAGASRGRSGDLTSPDGQAPGVRWREDIGDGYRSSVARSSWAPPGQGAATDPKHGADHPCPAAGDTLRGEATYARRDGYPSVWCYRLPRRGPRPETRPPPCAGQLGGGGGALAGQPGVRHGAVRCAASLAQLLAGPRRTGRLPTDSRGRRPDDLGQPHPDGRRDGRQCRPNTTSVPHPAMRWRRCTIGDGSGLSFAPGGHFHESAVRPREYSFLRTRREHRRR